MKKIIIAIFGPPGSGKGTQARIIAKKYKLKHIEIGSLVRAMIKKDQQARQRYQQGIPQPDKTIIHIVANTIEKSRSKRLILDPYPISLQQAKSLTTLIKKHKIDIFKLIIFQVTAQEVEKRMLARQEGRLDDNPAAIRNRIRINLARVKRITNYFKNDDCLIITDGQPKIPIVTRDLLTKLNNEIQ